jgi:hypothetical protein
LFPADLMFQLTKAEWDNLRFQIETSGYGGRRYYPYAFTEHAVTNKFFVPGSSISIVLQWRRTLVQMKH